MAESEHNSCSDATPQKKDMSDIVVCSNAARTSQRKEKTVVIGIDGSDNALFALKCEYS